MAEKAGQFSKSVVTQLGKGMIVESQNGKILSFTRVALGDGLIEDGEDIEKLTLIKKERLSCPIRSFVDKGNGQFTLQFEVSNTALEKGFWHREIGVMAKIGASAEQLYAYSYAGIAASFLYDKTTLIQERLVKIDVVVGNTENLTVVIDSSIIHPTMAEVGARLDEHNKAPDAHADIRTAISNASIAILQRSRTYQVGDIAYHKALPSWARLECVKAGTAAATLPTQIEQMVQNGGVIVTDGTVVWIVDDLRDGTPVGAVRGSLYLPAGYVKANGATVQRADYPRLVALADRHNLWTDDTAANAGLFGRGDGAATMVLPNWTDRMVQLAGDGAGASIAHGLPNITERLYGVAPYNVAAQLFSEVELSGEGALYVKDVAAKRLTTDASGLENKAPQSIDFDASRSNPTYGASATVQPPAIKLIPVIRY